MPKSKAFHGPVTDGRYDDVHVLEAFSAVNVLEGMRFNLRDGDLMNVIPTAGADLLLQLSHSGTVNFTVPFMREIDGEMLGGVNNFVQNWDMGGCELYPFEVV